MSATSSAPPSSLAPDHPGLRRPASVLRPPGPGPARALRRPRRTDPRLVAGGLLTLIGVLGAAIFWSGASEGQALVVSTRDLPAGARLGTGDLAVVRVRLSDSMLRSTVPAAEQASLLGRELAEPVHAQQLLVRAHLAGRPLLSGDQRAMTIAVGPDRAAGGLVRPGDAVMVLASPRPPADAGAEVVLPRVTVYEVGYDERAAGLAPAPGGRPRRLPVSSLTLLVTDVQALQLAKARARADLDVALLPPDAQPAQAAAVPAAAPR